MARIISSGRGEESLAALLATTRTDFSGVEMKITRFLASAGITITLLVPTTASLANAAPAESSPGSSGSTGSTDFGSSLPPGFDANSILPRPITDDPFFNWPTDVANYSPGQIIRHRTINPISLVGLAIPIDTHQLMVRSNDAKGLPAPVTSSLIVPKAPWQGPGSRPLIAYNMPIDSLGADCTPSYEFAHRPLVIEQDLPPMIPLFLSRGYGVLITDHQGPRMAYAAGRMAAHATLDSIRGTQALTDLGFADSRIVIQGYSGGAIAAGWAAELHPTYAPELNIVGAAVGGAPTDYGLLKETMNGGIASGLYMAAIMGLFREYPELMELANDTGKSLAASPLKDLCVLPIALTGIAHLPATLFSNTANPFDHPIAQEVIAQNRMGAQAPTAPVLLYHGDAAVLLGDIWIPAEGPRALHTEWCSKGANVTYSPHAGGHFISAVTSLPTLVSWIDARIAGAPVANGCG